METGQILQHEMLQQIHHDDSRDFAHIQTNGVGPKRGKVNQVRLYAYQGGPIIETAPDGESINVSHHGANGYSVNVPYPTVKRFTPTIDKSTGDAVASGIVGGIVGGII